MGNIAVLPEELSNRIAAGEVVERPASVVKELFENSVDAGATAITVEIERAGSKLIRISDNGSGMDAADAKLCFSPHATSKIKSVIDIDRIATLGFRGEALPSIASVSKLTLKTRMSSSLEGLELELEAGRIVAERPAGLAVGTTIAVKDLFFNVPARKKFLRSPATEEAHIQETVIALALGFPLVDVTLKFDGKVALQAPGSAKLATRAAGVFGKAFAQRMLTVDYTDGDVSVNGLIALPGFTRTSRREQRTFVNGRAVESLTMYRGIRDGYGTLADFGRFPPTVLNLAIDVGEYDINVHPTKKEVRFKQEYVVSRIIEAAVRNALQSAPAPEINIPEIPGKKVSAGMLMGGAEIGYQPKNEIPAIPGLEAAAPPEPPRSVEPAAPVFSSVERIIAEVPKRNIDIPDKSFAVPAAGKVSPAVPPEAIDEKAEVSPEKSAPELNNQQAVTQFTDESPGVELPPPAPVRSLQSAELADIVNLRYIGVVFGTFVAVESVNSDALLLIDFHAAHERVLFERLLARAQKGEAVPSQALLLPLTVEMSRPAAAFLNKNEKLFSDLGFDVALLSSNTVMLNAVPASLPGDADWEKILSDIVTQAIEGERNPRSSLENIARMACHAAVKANDRFTEESARALLKDLAQCERPDVCPHGRPTVLRLTKSELSRRFGRI